MSRVVLAARGWLGTPYLHQASCKGVGCDCLGLVLGIWRELHGALPAQIPPYTPDWSEAAGDERLLRAAQTHLIEKPAHAARPGDVLLFRMRERAVAKHMGIQTEIGDAPRFIHAYSRRAVTENALTPPWRRRIAARFAFDLKE